MIIPNGDVLSHNIINWTLNDNHVRQSLSFTIEKPSNLQDIGPDAIKEIVLKNPNVLEQRQPEVVMNTISSKTMELKIFFWIKDFNKGTLTSGEVKAAVYEYLEKKGLTVL